MDSPIEFTEFMAAITSLKNNKAPGKDYITNEDIKSLLPHESYESDSFDFSEMALNKMFNLFEVFWKYMKKSL